MKTYIDMPPGDILIMAIVVTLLLGVFLGLVALAGRRPYNDQVSAASPQLGPIQGGMHHGDPRSVTPHRDEPAAPPVPADRTSGQQPPGASPPGEGTEGTGTEKAARSDSPMSL